MGILTGDFNIGIFIGDFIMRIFIGFLIGFGKLKILGNTCKRI
jgi:hypothetical protein